MTDQFTGHDLLFNKLKEIKNVQAIRLFARIYDERIGHSDSKHVSVFLPDMHILTEKTRRKYQYGFNEESTLVNLLKTLWNLQRDQEDYLIKVYHLGDFVDLWKEGTADPTLILSEHQRVRNYLYSAGAKSSVNAQFLLGNHDIDLALVPLLKNRWDFRFFLPHDAEDRDLRIYVTHGDIFDPIEKLPKSLKAWIVYHFSPKTKRPQEITNDLVVWKERNNKRLEKQFGKVFHVEPLIDASEAVFRDPQYFKYNVKNQHDEKKHKFLDGCLQRVSNMNKEDNLLITACIIGHTHQPGISVFDDSNGFFVLMDCGAWVGSFVETSSAATERTTKPKPKCQIGVICGNDFRVYQLDSKDVVIR